MGMIGNTPYQGLIGTYNIQDGAITAAKIAAAADLVAKLGYTPVNKAGDTFTGKVTVAAAPGVSYGELFVLSNTAATSSNTSFGGLRMSSAPGLDWHAGKKNVNTASYFVLRDDINEWLNVSTAGLFNLLGNAKVLNSASVDQPVFGGNWGGTNYWGIGHFGSGNHVVRIGERDTTGAWATQSSDIALYIGSSLANTRANTRTFMAFDATQPDGSYGTWQKLTGASDTGYAAASGSWGLTSNGDTTIPEDGRYLVTYKTTGDGNDLNYARVIIAVNQSRSGADIQSYGNFLNQFGTFTNPNSVYSGYSDGAHSVILSQVYRCLAGDVLAFYGQGDLNSPFPARVSITKLGEL